MDENATSRRTVLAVGASGAIAGAAGLVPMPPLSSAAPEGGESLDVRLMGAKGDGATDDSAVFQAALDALGKRPEGGAIRVPAGRYRIGRPLEIRASSRLSIVGEGYVSRLQMERDEPLLRAGEGVGVDKAFVADLTIESVGAAKSAGTPAVAFDGGMTGCTFSNVRFDGESVPLGGAVRVRKVADTSAFMNCVSWGTLGTAFEIAMGSEVRFFGGRIIGAGIEPGTVGILLTGNNGGVHVVTTDIIRHHTGLQIGGVGGVRNREIFLTQATFDSSVYGVRQYDAAYVSVAGIWAASSDEAQIQIEESAKGALLVCAGGTIFNGGAYGRAGAKNGLVAKAGGFSLTGVDVRNNEGIGVLVGPGAKDWMMTGCRIHDNGEGVRAPKSGRRVVANNLVFGNGEANK